MVYQLGSTLLDAFVLAIVSQEDTYGYLISQRIKKAIDIKESTLYPVLRRLQENGYLDTYDQPYQGRNRRYYHLTKTGREKYKYFIDEWLSYKENVEQILLGGNIHE